MNMSTARLARLAALLVGGVMVAGVVTARAEYSAKVRRRVSESVTAPTHAARRAASWGVIRWRAPSAVTRVISTRTPPVIDSFPKSIFP